MAVAMAAMMVPTAAPFFVAYARGVRGPAPTAALVGAYVAVWSVVGVAGYFVMSFAMVPSYAGAIAIALGVTWSITPWARRAAARCRDMCLERPADPLRSGLTYSANCIVCSAGVMLAVMVFGMDNIAWLAAGSAAVLVYKTTGGGVRQPIRDS